MSKRSLILGPGQDGSYLCEILLEQGCDVHVMHRRSSVDNLCRIRHLLDRVTLYRGDMTDSGSLWATIRSSEPDEIYAMADQDDSGWSNCIPTYALDVTAGGPLRLLEIVKQLTLRGDLSTKVKVFQPVSALMFGMAPPHQDENTPFDPRSPFAVAKVATYYLCRHYRREHGLFVSTSISFNHDSPTRSEDYVLHKICKAAVRIARGEQDKLVLGNLETRIDIGYARDYMEAAVAMLQLPEPDDFVIGTGEAWRIKAMVYEAFAAARVPAPPAYMDRVVVDPKFQRPGPQPTLIANPAKARVAFGFNPPTGIAQLIHMLVEHEQEVQ